MSENILPNAIKAIKAEIEQCNKIIEDSTGETLSLIMSSRIYAFNVCLNYLQQGYEILLPLPDGIKSIPSFINFELQSNWHTLDANMVYESSITQPRQFVYELTLFNRSEGGTLSYLYDTTSDAESDLCLLNLVLCVGDICKKSK